MPGLCSARQARVLMHGVSVWGDCNGSLPAWQTHSQNPSGLRFPRSITQNKLKSSLIKLNLRPVRIRRAVVGSVAQGISRRQRPNSHLFALRFVLIEQRRIRRVPLLPSSCWSWLQLVVFARTSGYFQGLMSPQTLQVDDMSRRNHWSGVKFVIFVNNHWIYLCNWLTFGAKPIRDGHIPPLIFEPAMTNMLGRWAKKIHISYDKRE